MRPAAKAIAAAILAGTGLLVIPTAFQAANLLRQPDNMDAITTYRLKAEPHERISAAIEAALTEEDPELAASLLDVATDLQTPLPPDLVQRVTDAQGFSARRLAGDIWDGITQGDTSSEAGLGGALAADLTGVGDVRDLIREGGNYLENGTYDPVVLTLATAGLALTVATVMTAGAAAPARTGVTILKAAKKSGNLPAPLVAEFVTLSKNAIDRTALDETLSLAKRLDLSGAAAASGRVLRPAVLETVTRTADDVAGIASSAGYRAVNQTLKIAESTADISKLRRFAATAGTKFRGTLALLGASALSLAGLTLTLAGWAFTGFLWLLAAGFFVLGFFRSMLSAIFRLARWGAKPPRPPSPAPR